MEDLFIKPKSERKLFETGGRMTKHKGTVSSIAPQACDSWHIPLSSAVYFFSASISIMLFAISLAEPGAAGTCREKTDGSLLECSGNANPLTDEDISVSVSQTIDNLIVRTIEGFGHDNTKSTDSIGIEIIDNGKITSDISYTDDYNSIIKSSAYALGIQSNNRGNIIISSNGEFFSEGKTGVIIDNNGIANINAVFHKITGKEAGLFLNNKENVTSKITTTGDIQGEERAGILVLAEGGELELTANGKITGQSGIISVGFTDSKITTTDQVTGRGDAGIFSNVTNTGSDLTIKAHNVTGAVRGILTDNYGSGDTNITTTGLVKGETDHGIWAAHKGKNLNINTNDVTGKIHGIHIDNTLAHGDITVTSTGTITAGETGIYTNLDTPSYHTEIIVNDIIAGYQGIYAAHQHGGNFIITVNGDIEVQPGEFDLSSFNNQSQTRCLSTENDGSCGVVEIDTPGDAFLGVSGNIKARKDLSDPQVSVDLTGVEGIALLLINDRGQIDGQALTRIDDTDLGQDGLIFAGNEAAHKLDLANIGNKNAKLAFIGFDKLIKQDAGRLSLTGTQSGGAFDSVEFYGGEIEFDDITLLLKDKKSYVTVVRGAGVNITGKTRSEITGSVINQGVISTKPAAASDENRGLNIGGSLTNEGSISLQDGFVGNQVVVQGDYIANNDVLNERPQLIFETTLNDDTSATDKLIVRGNSSGHTNIEVVSLIKPGAKTLDGIPVIEVAGQSDGTFALSTGDYKNEDGEWELIGGAYSYTLRKSGKNWNLTSFETSDSSENTDPPAPTTSTDPKPGKELPGKAPDPEMKPVKNATPHAPGSQEKPLPPKPETTTPKKRRLQPGVAVAMAASEHALFLNRFTSLYQRAGARHDGLFISAPKTGVKSASWISIDNSQADHDDQTTESTGHHNATKIGFGIDFASQPDTARYVIGLNGYIGNSGARTKSKSGYGQINTKSYGIGATGTAYSENTYLDMQARYHHLSSDLVSKEIGVIAQHQKGKSYGFSIETGHQIQTGDLWSLTPQAQLSYSKSSLDSFEDFKKNKFEFADMNEITVRLGTALESKVSTGKGETYIYGQANIYHALKDKSTIKISDVKFSGDKRNANAEFIIGAEYRINNSDARLYGEIQLASDIDNLKNITQSNINVGTNISW